MESLPNKRRRIEKPASSQAKSESSPKITDSLSPTPKLAFGFPTELVERNVFIDKTAQRIAKGHGIIQTALDQLQVDDLTESLRRDLCKVVDSSVDTPCTIAILGASGCGKSTLFNALLDQVGILPTGSLGQACTAAAIELHSNEGREHAFVAELIHITAQDWIVDVDKALEALRAPPEFRQHALSPIAKLRTVYPELTDERLKTMTTEQVLASNELRNDLGTTKTIACDDSESFKKELRSMVVALKKDYAARWPLLSVVRVYIHSPFLQDGLVLADVPGVMDSNAARNSRAKEYLQKCSAVCIATPALRGGSDGGLPDMIADALRDVSYGGHLDRVVLVSTKSDDVSLSEIEADLEVMKKEECSKVRAKKEDELNLVKYELEVAQQDLDKQDKTSDYARKDHTRWKDAKRSLKKKQPTFAPRTRIGLSNKFVKAEKDREEVTDAEVQQWLEYFEKRQKNADAECTKLQNRIAERQAHADTLQAEIDELNLRAHKLVITARNDELKKAQVEMYMDEVQMHDSQIAQAAAEVTDNDDTTHPNPIKDAQYYETLRTRLPVFCVSARAYRHMNGLSPDAPSTNALTDLSDTEIPALAAHLRKIATDARSERLNSLNDEMLLVLSRLNMFLSQDVETREVDPTIAERAIDEATTLFDKLPDIFTKSLKCAEENITDTYSAQITAKLAKIKKASSKFVAAEMESWVEKPASDRSNKGLYYQEYRAACRHEGDWHGRSKVFDMNEWVRLVLQTVVQGRMEQLFTMARGVTGVAMADCVKFLGECVEGVHVDVRGRAVEAGVKTWWLDELDRQHVRRKNGLGEILEGARGKIGAVYAAASFDMAGDVKRKWRGGYKRAALVGTSRESMAEQLDKALVGDNVLGVVLTKWDGRLVKGLLDEFERVRRELGVFVEGMVDAYRGALEKREGVIETAKNPVHQKLRNLIRASGLLETNGEGEDAVKEEDEISDYTEMETDDEL